jgi:light-harvesting protein B-800-850 alpha chain
MNNAKMWLVVKPTVGVPLFLAGVAIGSFAVHVAVLTNTAWVSDFLKGQPLGSSAAAQIMVDPQTSNAAYRPGVSQDVIVTLPDGTKAHAVLTLPDET